MAHQIFEVDLSEQIKASRSMNCDQCGQQLGEHYLKSRTAIGVTLPMGKDGDGYDSYKEHHFCNEDCMRDHLNARAFMTSKASLAEGAKKQTDHKSEYGDVEYADPKNHKYPINSEERVRAAWSYINMPKNHAGYTPEEVAAIKSRIKSKFKEYGIDSQDK